MPLTIDPTGVYVRPEGPAFIGGYSPREGEPDPDTFDLEVDRSKFEGFVWPTLAHRVPAFEAIRLLDAWAGHYEVNTLDHNGVIGPHPEVRNFLFAGLIPLVGGVMMAYIAVKAFSFYNTAGNKYRLITVIHFNTGRVYVRRILTHAEYDRGAWKDDD